MSLVETTTNDRPRSSRDDLVRLEPVVCDVVERVRLASLAQKA